MTTSILATKLYIPPARPELVSRPRLIKRLNAGLHRKLTLISAPAGFGKTTLVSEWAHSRGGVTAPLRVAWLSLDESDNDPTRFLTYFIAALQTIDANLAIGALSSLQSPQPPPTEVVLTSLINDIAAIPDGIVLVLDDYHLIEARPIHDALTFLLRRLPPQMHLVIATREDPDLPLARLRAQGQLTELRAADLRFTSSEAAEFLNQVMGMDLSTEDIAALETRTEGWIAGLQLAAISMQGSKDATGFIKSFTGSHRYVLDYLIEEVLEQQPESVQTFLLQTAVLNRLTGSLCDALTGQDNGQATLEMLERANLFIVSLDEERRWYRYHYLFADLLLQRLRQSQLKQESKLHYLASEWYEQNGFIDEAIEHALRADDFDHAADMIEKHVDAIWGYGQHAILQRWVAELPDALVFSKPQLCIFHAWYLWVNGQLDAAERTLQAAEQAIDSSTDRATETQPQEQVSITNSDRVKLQGRAAAVRAFMSSYRGDVPGIIQHARQALEYLPQQDLTWRSLTAIALGDAHLFKGDMTEAYRARLEALETSKAAGDIYLNVIVNQKLLVVLRQRGQLQQTIEVCQQLMQYANESGISETVMVGNLLANWGEVLAEKNDLDGAIELVRKGVGLTESGRDVGILGWSYLCLARVLFSKGDLTGAEEIIQNVEVIARESTAPLWVTNHLAAWKVRIWLAHDKLDDASHWVQERGLSPETETTYLGGLLYIALARILIAQGLLEEATKVLQHLLETAEAGGHTTRTIEILILQALASQAGGDTTQAMVTLEQALTLAEPGGFIRIFVDEGPPMARLLYEAAARGIMPDYTRKLLATYEDATKDERRMMEPSPSSSVIRPSSLVEPLSERELEVLQLIAQGLSNREISERLFLALSTVKGHNRRIYGKLGVKNRTQAINKARALNILPPQ